MPSGLVREGRTTFQIKTGDFKPAQPSAIHKELFGEAGAVKKNLGKPIRECLDSKGTYVLVCTGVDLADKLEKAKKNLSVKFAKCGYPDANVDVLSQNQLIGLLESFPSLSLDLNGNGAGAFETHKAWANQGQMRTAFMPGRKQMDFINSVAAESRRGGAAIHVHVNGEPGIGKTRLVLEALRFDDLAPLVVYCAGPSQTLKDNLLNLILREDNPFEIILVVDECDADARAALWNKLVNVGPRLRLITINSEFDETAGNTSFLTAVELESEQIIEILKLYVPSLDSAERWAELCSGSPRVAHVVGLNLKNNPDDLLKSPNTVIVWDRYIVGPDKADSDDVRQRITVLHRLALFKRFGYGKAVMKEAEAIAELVVKDDQSIGWARFQEIVHQLRSRKILQGENTLYITPKLLHIKLWTEWWEIHAQSFDFAQLANSIPPKLLEWFNEMTKYASESKAAEKQLKSLLDENGPFQRSGMLSDPRGARLFLALTEATPYAALQTLKNTVGVWSREQLLQFTTGRREVVRALERIAVWRDLFSDAARLLLKLADAENENWDNNATGVFAGLFSNGYGRVAPTEAPPEERFAVLKEALEHPSRECRRVGLKACDSALEAGHFSRMIGAEYQGLRRQPVLWMPKTWGELFDSYRRVWGLVWERLDVLPEDERPEAVDVLLENTRGLAMIANLSMMALETLEKLTSKPYVSKSKVIATVESILHYDAPGFAAELREAWQALVTRLIGDDFSSLMQRYVALDLIEDRLEGRGKMVDKAGPKIEALAKQALENPELLHAELKWLVTDQAKSGHRFGYSLGMNDPSFLLLPTLLEAQRGVSQNASLVFAGGYHRALFERDAELWEEKMDEMADDPILRAFIPEITWRSGLTDRGAARILSLAKSEIVPPSAFNFFAYGGVIRQLSEARFVEWADHLLGVGSREASGCALQLFSYFYPVEKKGDLPRKLTKELLMSEPFFRSPGGAFWSQMEDWYWTQLGIAFVSQFPEDGIELANKMLEHFRSEGTVLAGFDSQTDQVLNIVVQQQPSKLWEAISAYLGPPVDTRAFHLREWLRGGVLSWIPAEDVWKWVEKEIEKRPWYLATMVPKVFPGDENRASARSLLVRYGARDDVRRNLQANFSSGSWTGPESTHYKGQLDQLRAWRKDERDQNVLRWIDEYSASLEWQIENAQVREEREF